MPNTIQTSKRLPQWLRRTLPAQSSEKTHEILERYGLNTVCESARCPNRSECYSHRTATFMILGNSCTRRCGFCSVPTGRGEEVQEDEPERVARAAQDLGLHYIVVTSVARDDLRDQGAGHFAKTIRAIRDRIPDAEIEVLTPDFHACEDLIRQIVEAKPEVYNHNIETVERLQKKVRPQAGYARSLQVLEMVKRMSADILTKSGIMLGLGETEEEVFKTSEDLRKAGCDILTVGQYLPPGREFLEVQDYVAPQIFDRMARELKALGFKQVFAGPYVRSSYHAGETFSNAFANT